MTQITTVLINTINPELSYDVLEFCRIEMEENKLFQLSPVLLFTSRILNRNITSCTKSNIHNPIVVIKVDINSWEDYNNFCLYELNSYIKTDYVLMMQTDGFIVNPNAWTDEFLDYDYIGAPWNHELVTRYGEDLDRLGEEAKNEMLTKKMLCGNGGFSLRSKKLLELSTKLIDRSTTQTSRQCPNEDVTICNTNRKYLVDHGIKFSTVEVGFQFSVEHTLESGIYEAGRYNGSFGFHGKGVPNLPSLPQYVMGDVR